MRDFALPGRSVAYGESGMAATSHPLATLAAVDVLRAGGNAVDAAVAAVAVQCVVEPAMTGIGGDCFVLLAPAAGGVVALNGSGRAPQAATVERLQAAGVERARRQRPRGHRAGRGRCLGAAARAPTARKGLDELLQPAIRHAEQGFLVTPRVAWDWARSGQRLLRSAAGRVFYLPDDHAPVAGQKLRLPALANTLRRIAAEGPDAFYRGELAERMVVFLSGEGGLHSLDDFASAAGEFVAPISTRYRDFEIYECPPNGQGVIALLMLNILKGFELAGLEPGRPRAPASAGRGDPARLSRPRRLAGRPAPGRGAGRPPADEGYAGELRRLIDPDAGAAGAAAAASGRARRHGLPHRGRSRPQRRLLHQLGLRQLRQRSGLPRDRRPVPQPRQVVRARSEPSQPDRAGQAADAYDHPGARAAGGRPALAFGVMGGHYQPVGHVQILTNLVEYGQDPQVALDAPRSFAYGGELADRDRRAGRDRPGAGKARPQGRGRRQAAGRRPDIAIDHERGVLLGGSDPRKDGLALGY